MTSEILLLNVISKGGKGRDLLIDKILDIFPH